MNRTVTLVAITLLSAVGAPVVVNATTPRAMAVIATLAAEPKSEQPTCARTIKVVYAGYGEARSVPCLVFVR